MRFLAPLRRPIERVPIVAETYRLLRDFVQFRTSRPADLPTGFKLMGDPKMVSGHYELDETALMLELLATNDVFIDVGANIGYYTCLARLKGADVVAFEPSASALRYLYANLLANGLRDVEVLPLGLSDRIDLLTLYGTGGSASLIDGWSRASNQFATVIPTTTLDHVLAHRFAERRLLIKIDIEGGELPCLRGATATLARPVAPTWFVEIYCVTGKGRRNPQFLETFELFWDHGYEAREARKDADVITPTRVKAWAAGREVPASANYVFSRGAR